MAEFENIEQMFKNIPHMGNHLRDLNDNWENMRDSNGGCKDYGIVENSCISHTERKIMCSMNVGNKFSYKNMAKGLPLRIFSHATRDGDGSTGKSVKHRSNEKIKWVTGHIKTLSVGIYEEEISLSNGVAYYSEPTLSCNAVNVFDGLSPQQVNCLNALSCTEAAVVKPNLKNLILKMYLMCCDYAINSFSRSVNIINCGNTENVVDVRGRRGATQMAYAGKGGIIANERAFSKNELAFLILASGEYPCVKFGEDNIYNTIRIYEDRLILLGKNDRGKIDNDFSPISVESMYKSMINIITKLGGFNQIGEVISEWRGMPKLLDRISETVGDISLNGMYNRSHSAECLFGDSNMIKKYRGKSSNYMVSTIGVICDLVLGEVLNTGIDNLISDMGVLGDMYNCAGDELRSNPVYNSVLRECGFKSCKKDKNPMIREWSFIKGTEIPLGFRGIIKDVACARADNLHTQEGITSFGVLNHFIDVSTTSISPWRGGKMCDSRKGAIEGESIITDTEMKRGFMYSMGVVKRMPRFGENLVGLCLPNVLDDEEREMLESMDGKYHVNYVAISISGQVRGLNDLSESVYISEYNTRFKGSMGPMSYTETEIGLELKPFEEGEDVTGERSTFQRREDLGSEIEEIQMAPRLAKITVSKKPKTGSRKFNLPSKETLINTRLGIDIRRGETDSVQWVRAIPDGEKERFNYSTIDVPGDGSCGLHVIVEGLVRKGLINESEKSMAMQTLRNDKSINESFHDASELATVCARARVGLRLYDRELGRVMDFSTKDVDESDVIEVERDGAHFRLIVPGNANSGTVKFHDGGQQSPEQFLSHMEEIGISRIFELKRKI